MADDKFEQLVTLLIKRHDKEILTLQKEVKHMAANETEFKDSLAKLATAFTAHVTKDAEKDTEIKTLKEQLAAASQPRDFQPEVDIIDGLTKQVTDATPAQ